MPRLFPTFLFLIICYTSQAGIIRGRVYGEKQSPLPFASIFIKGTTTGTTSNGAGVYQLDLPAGTYTLVCQYMGYKKTEKNITVTDAVQEIDFVLTPLSLQIKEVVVKSGGEDPAYAIIRQAIKKRPYYLNQVKEYTCND
ncbi:MAG TPA: carboxypeptidase-like regulatory domain-containing protein, partial [Chitinophaga sp.]|nr:carboxypeptidase-like regulatory domain-containing protein [Chitinophaga sp.]